MKTLKQIREEYDSRFVPPMEIPEELMLEGADKGKMKSISVIPSNREMPPILIFRRLTWKTYPGKQVVALYYSKLVDKYLSIPFGPTGNLNINESKVYDTIEDLEEGILGAITGGIAGAKSGPMGAVLGAASGYMSGGSDSEEKKPTEIKVTSGDGPKKIGGYAAGKEPRMIKRGNAFAKGMNRGDASFQSKLKTATIKDMQAQKKALKENKVSDLRKMIKEGVELKDLSINGRTVPLNRNMAKKIVEVYDSVNVINKRKIENMLNENLESFKKLLNFSIKQ